MTEHYIVRAEETERKLIRSLIKKYRKVNPRLKIRDIEILIRSMKFYVEVSK